MFELVEQQNDFFSEFNRLQTKFHESIDLTSLLKSQPAYRRFDALARLLECATNCVAVSMIEKQIIIAANAVVSLDPEQDKGKTKQETIVTKNVMLESFINDVLEYFSLVVTEGKSDDKRRKEIFYKICSPDRFISLVKKSKIAIPTEILNDIIGKVFNEEYKSITIYQLEKLYGRTSGAGAAFLECVNIYKDFKRLEKSLLQAKEGNFLKIHEEQFIAFKEKKISVLITDIPTYHAEMQVIFKLLEKAFSIPDYDLKGKQYYIGISKPCCMNCHMMIYAVNSVLQTINNLPNPFTFFVRGWHITKSNDVKVPKEVVSLLFGEKNSGLIWETYSKIWREELDREKGTSRKSSLLPIGAPIELGSNVGMLYTPQANATMRHLRSITPESDQSLPYEYTVEVNKHYLEQTKNMLNKLSQESIFCGDLTKLIEIGLLFHSEEVKNEYKRLFSSSGLEDSEIETYLVTFLTSLRNNSAVMEYLSKNDSDLKLFKAFFDNNELFKSEIHEQVRLSLNKCLPAFAESCKVRHTPSVGQ